MESAPRQKTSSPGSSPETWVRPLSVAVRVRFNRTIARSPEATIPAMANSWRKDGWLPVNARPMPCPGAPNLWRRAEPSGAPRVPVSGNGCEALAEQRVVLLGQAFEVVAEVGRDRIAYPIDALRVEIVPPPFERCADLHVRRIGGTGRRGTERRQTHPCRDESYQACCHRPPDLGRGGNEQAHKEPCRSISSMRRQHDSPRQAWSCPIAGSWSTASAIHGPVPFGHGGQGCSAAARRRRWVTQVVLYRPARISMAPRSRACRMSQ